jgi:putative Holliday junction resolvase
MAINTVLGLDIGEKRVGIARVNMIARLPEPLITLANDDLFDTHLRQIIDEHQPDALVVGLPRNLKGEETAQSTYSRQFSQSHLESIGLPVIFQDETLSSNEAKVRLGTAVAKKGDIDAMAATVILEDYLETI